MRGIQHQIDLVSRANLPNLPYYRINSKKDEILKEIIDELLRKSLTIWFEVFTVTSQNSRMLHLKSQNSYTTMANIVQNVKHHSKLCICSVLGMYLILYQFRKVLNIYNCYKKDNCEYTDYTYNDEKQIATNPCQIQEDCQ